LTEATGLHRRAIDLRARRERADEVSDGLPAEALDPALDELPEHCRGRLRISQGGVDGLDLDLQRLNQAGEARCLAAGQLEDQAPESRRVDHRVLERSGQAPAQDPGVEGIVAVLDQDRSTSEMEEGPSGVPELGRVDEHLAFDQVPSLGVGVDRGPGVDQGVEEAQGAGEAEPFSPDLEHQEGPVAGRLDVDGDELRLFERRVRAHRDVVLFGARRPEDRLG
jgi:hypothetical protein